MLGSRSLGLLRRVATHLSGNTRNQILQTSRKSHTWSYRVGAPPASKKTIYTAEALGGFMWWWILWHFWHEHEHVTGEFAYPDPSKWTNAELGIPGDDEEV